MYNYYNNPYPMNSAPTATQPYGYPMPPYVGNQYQTQQPQQPAVVNTNKIFVGGIEDVKNKQLPFNSDMLFVDNDKPFLYQKIVDSKGQFEIKTFDITPHDSQKDEKQNCTVDLSNYVEKSKFEALEGEIRALKDKINKITLK